MKSAFPIALLCVGAASCGPLKSGDGLADLSPCEAAAFDAPRPLDLTAERPSFEPHIVVGDDGTATATWFERGERDVLRLMGRQINPRGIYQPALRLDDPSSSLLRQAASCVHHRSGDATVLWVEEDDAGTQRVQWRRLDASQRSWLPRQTLSVVEGPTTLHCAIDDDGTMLVVWQSTDPVDPERSVGRAVFVERKGKVGPVTQLHDAVLLESFRVSLGRDGRALVGWVAGDRVEACAFVRRWDGAWRDAEELVCGFVPASIELAVGAGQSPVLAGFSDGGFEAQGTFWAFGVGPSPTSTTELLSDFIAPPLSAVAARGDAGVAVLLSLDSAWVARFDGAGGRWSDPVPFADDAVFATWFNPRLVPGPEGLAHVIHHDDNRLLATRLEGEAADMPQIVFRGDLNDIPEAAGDARGCPQVVWTGFQRGRERAYFGRAASSP